MLGVSRYAWHGSMIQLWMHNVSGVNKKVQKQSKKVPENYTEISRRKNGRSAKFRCLYQMGSFPIHKGQFPYTFHLKILTTFSFLKQAKSNHTKRDVLGTMTDLEQFLDHYGSEAKPSDLDVGQQLVIGRVSKF